MKQNGIQVEYCPTDLMVADFFTKPLQGSLFKKFKDVIMGHKPMSSLYRTVQKEHVGNDSIVECDINMTSCEKKKSEQVENRKPTWAEIVIK